MEIFRPGADYGTPYHKFIWVCDNPNPRNFERCSPTAVQKDVHDEIQMYLGLGPRNEDTFLMRSSCMLGCKSDGTAVALASDQGLNIEGRPHTLFLRNVQKADVPKLLSYLA